ncbi:acyl carrier protein [Pseudomonas huanghezhanensis]|uniref:acyl carrier protein n=1 Tax=Pseudomonas huanghezhanensis TaxID=3002903 RepID=UPI002286264D|nr:acyl carrier protein [Pseudomonas sp. BSw22131]
MDKAEVASRTKKIIAKYLAVDERNVSETSGIYSLGADSLDVVEIAIALEEEFGIKIAEDEGKDILTVGEVIDLVFKKNPR